MAFDAVENAGSKREAVADSVSGMNLSRTDMSVGCTTHQSGVLQLVGVIVVDNV